MSKHFTAAVQKVGTFVVAGKEKKGGNVASYFCTAEGFVLHAIAGPVKAEDFLREARWAVETWNLMHLDKVKGPAAREFFRRAHLDRLRAEHGWTHGIVPAPGPTEMGALLRRYAGMGNQGRIHLLLTSMPAPPVENVYRLVFERILNERISTRPVAIAER